MEPTRNILVVDDAPEMRAWLQAVLSQDGWQVHTARDGAAATEMITQLDFHLVITDWMMPVMNGLQLIEWIRQRETGHYVYTILMTARGSKEDSIEGLSSGADDYLVKPASVDILRTRLAVAGRILERHNALLEQRDRLGKSRDPAAFGMSRSTAPTTVTEARSQVLSKGSLP